MAAMTNPASGRERLREIARRAMRQRGFEPDFPPAVTAETAAVVQPALDPPADVRDLRALPWFSIDNDDSRDLDQLTAAQEQPGGSLRLLVAVADVDAALARGGAIDARARTNTTSVYTPAQVFPMLPERLSTDLTSLNDGEDRLAVVVALETSRDGRVSGSSLYRARVRNKAKLAYDAVAAWLDGHAEPPAAVAASREIKAALAGAPCPYEASELRALAAHCTRQEDDAVRIERQVVKSAAALLLAPRKGDRFDAIVTGASGKGTWVRVFQPPAEGKLVRGQEGLDVGERVSVRLVDVDVERGFIDFARA